jgi:hypothetical protein
MLLTFTWQTFSYFDAVTKKTFYTNTFGFVEHIY